MVSRLSLWKSQVFSDPNQFASDGAKVQLMDVLDKRSARLGRGQLKSLSWRGSLLGRANRNLRRLNQFPLIQRQGPEAIAPILDSLVQR